MKAPPKPCPVCAQNPAGLAVCPACGRKLAPPKVAAPPKVEASRAPPRVRASLVPPPTISPAAPVPSDVEAPDQAEAIDDWLPQAYDLSEVVGPDAIADMPLHPSGSSTSLVGPPPDEPADESAEFAAQPWQRWESERSGERGRLEKNALLFGLGLVLLLALVFLLSWL